MAEREEITKQIVESIQNMRIIVAKLFGIHMWKAWSTWRGVTARTSQQRTLVSKILHRLISQSKYRSFSTWRDAAHEHRKLQVKAGTISLLLTVCFRCLACESCKRCQITHYLEHCIPGKIEPARLHSNMQRSKNATQ